MIPLLSMDLYQKTQSQTPPPVFSSQSRVRAVRHRQIILDLQYLTMLLF